MRLWPSCIGVDSGHHFGQGDANIMVDSADDLSIFSDASHEGIFSSHLLEHIVDTDKALTEWWRVLKVGGYLTLYLPHKAYYPNIGQDGANPDHKHDFLPGDILAAMARVSERSGHGYDVLEDEERARDWDVGEHKWGEYSFFQVFRKRADAAITYTPYRKPEGKTALVIRYGAIGDQLLAASILPQLKAEGYHVTWNTTPAAAKVIEHDPHVDAFFLQAKDQVPNEQLSPYWQMIEHEGRWDRIINLCESVEGSLLKLPGRLDHDYSDEARRRLYGTVSYLERTHDIAGVAHVFNARFYPNEKEVCWATAQLTEIAGDRPVVMMALVGSSAHKIYPWWPRVLKWTLEQTDAAVILVSDGGPGLEAQKTLIETTAENTDAANMARVHGRAGDWDLRQAMSIAQHVNVLVGPETGMLWSVASVPSVRKIVLLSHSSRQNFATHWQNLWALEPVKTPCFPCHRMHASIMGYRYCHFVEETKGALCASNIAPERVVKAILDTLRTKKAA